MGACRIPLLILLKFLFPQRNTVAPNGEGLKNVSCLFNFNRLEATNEHTFARSLHLNQENLKGWQITALFLLLKSTTDVFFFTVSPKGRMFVSPLCCCVCRTDRESRRNQFGIDSNDKVMSHLPARSLSGQNQVGDAQTLELNNACCNTEQPLTPPPGLSAGTSRGKLIWECLYL